MFIERIKIKPLVNIVKGLMYPSICPNCGQLLASGEHYVCSKCITKLPFTHWGNSRKNIIRELLFEKIQKLEKTYSLFYFIQKNDIHKLLHSLKYKNKPEIGIELGFLLGQKLQEADMTDFDKIIPIPLHLRKKKIRGYNQSTKIAQGIADTIDRPIDIKSVTRAIYTETQTKKNKYERIKNMKGVFSIKDPKKLENKHILIIDDIITTGATILSLSKEMSKIKGIKISIATLAVTKRQ